MDNILKERNCIDLYPILGRDVYCSFINQLFILSTEIVYVIFICLTISLRFVNLSMLKFSGCKMTEQPTNLLLEATTSELKSSL